MEIGIRGHIGVYDQIREMVFADNALKQITESYERTIKNLESERDRLWQLTQKLVKNPRRIACHCNVEGDLIDMMLRETWLLQKAGTKRKSTKPEAEQSETSLEPDTGNLALC